MKEKFLLTSSIAIGGWAVLSQATCAAVAASRPNIVFILTDDMGLGDISKTSSLWTI